MTEKQFTVVGLAVVALFVGLFAWLTWGEWQEYTKIGDEVKVLMAEIDQLNAKIRKIPEKRKERDTLVERFEEKRKILPNKAERENLIELLGYLCAQTGMLPPQSVNPVEARKGPGQRSAVGGIEEVLYQVKLNGPFFAFVKFVNWLEHYKRHVRLRTFTVTGGGGSETATKPQVVLGYDVLLVSYQYTGQAGAEEEKALVLEEPKISPQDKIEFEPDARDPFRFPLAPVAAEVGPRVPGSGDPPGTDTKIEEVLVRLLQEKLDVTDRLRRDINRIPADAPTAFLKEILDTHLALMDWVKNTKALGAESGRLLTQLRAALQDIDQRIPQVLYPLWTQRILEVTALVDEHTESRRYADVVLPTLTLVAQFKDFAPNPQVEQGLSGLFAKVTAALTLLVEEQSEYKRAIDLIAQLEKDLAPLRTSKLTTLYARFLDSLKEIKKKAEDIRMFRDLGIVVSGLIWGKDSDDRICIVHADRLTTNDPPGSKYRRRLFGENDVVGIIKGNAADTVTIRTITRDKKVVFEFRKLSIAVELGEPRKK